VDIQKVVRGINSRTLSKKLHDLEAEGLIEKQNYKEFPPRTEYSVTKKAKDLKAAIAGLKQWAGKYCPCDKQQLIVHNTTDKIIK